MTIVAYISGHGFGHASRTMEVLKAVLRREPDARIVVRTSVAPWFIDASLGGQVELQPAVTDTGITQLDSLRLDEIETAKSASIFYGVRHRSDPATEASMFRQRVDVESAILEDLATTVVVGDVPPLAFAAAHQAGRPSIAIANFTWDWIYAAYEDFEQLAPGVIALIGAAYAQATMALRLPFSGGFETMPAVRDIPLIARHARRSREAIRAALALPSHQPVVLASFGGHGLRRPYDEIARKSRLTLLVTEHETRRPEQQIDNLRCYSLQELKALDIRYEELVAAADVVVSKAGYGIVSECIANDAALLYTERGRFREQDVFDAELPSVLRCRAFPAEAFASGDWTEAVEALLLQEAPPTRLSTDGADDAAEAILSQRS